MTMAVATIKFVEGFASALRRYRSLVLNFRGIPEGVTVTASMMGTGTALDPADGDPPVMGGRFSPTHVEHRGGRAALMRTETSLCQ